MNSSDMIYFDYNGTTPMHPEVRKMMSDCLMNNINPSNPYISECFGNASSTYSYGLESKIALNTARQQVAKLLGCDSEEVFFTSGGTESNNIVIYGAVLNAIRAGVAEPHVIISAVEHPSVVEVVREAKRYFNVRESVLGVDKLGLVDLEQLKEMLTPDTCLVSVMLANNEVGTVNQTKAIKAIVDAHNARKDSRIFTVYHSDCS